MRFAGKSLSENVEASLTTFDNILIDLQLENNIFMDISVRFTIKVLYGGWLFYSFDTKDGVFN